MLLRQFYHRLVDFLGASSRLGYAVAAREYPAAAGDRPRPSPARERAGRAARRKSNPRPAFADYTPLTALRRRDRGAPEPSREGRAVRGGVAFRAAPSRSAPTLRPTGTTTGLRLVVRLKPVRRLLNAHRSGGELEDWGRKRCAGRLQGRHYLFLRGTPEAPRSLLMARRTEKLFDILGPSGRGTTSHVRLKACLIARRPFNSAARSAQP
jgi:hypothetical protein